MASLGFTAAAGADNPNGTPPGQDKANASTSTSSSTDAKAEEQVEAKAKGTAHGDAEAHGQASATTGAKSRGHAGGSGKSSAGASTHTEAKVHGHSGARVKASGHAGGRGHATVRSSTESSHARVQTQGGGSGSFSSHSSHNRVAATASVRTKSHGSAHARAGTSGHVSKRFAAAFGQGVKPSNATSKNTTAAAVSNQTKLYGNGKTAGQIAIQAGFGAAMLFGPGNSQPHKVLCGVPLVDVHALKAHGGACKTGLGAAMPFGPGKSRPHKVMCGLPLVDVHAPKAHGGACAAGLGVKPSNVTSKNTTAAASSNQTKLYGNGKTAGQIAIQAGFGAAMLFGPGNSQPHKVLCGVHLVDVHALKAHGGACKTAEAAVGPTKGVQSGTSPQASVAAPVAAGVPVTSAPVAITKTTTKATTKTTTKGGARAPAPASTPAKQSSPGAGAVNAGQQLLTAARPLSRAISAPVRGGQLPFTGLGLWLPMAVGIALIVGGYRVRRKANALP